MTLSSLFSLTRKKAGVILIVWIASILIHEGINHFLLTSERFFFYLSSIIIPAYLAISVLYTVTVKICYPENKVKKRRKK